MRESKILTILDVGRTLYVPSKEKNLGLKLGLPAGLALRH